ncbi:PTS Fru family IIB subunit [Clostridium estertheticum]|uniref:PTS Fru family IIB subunit n=1 Tax=Clostridium estertheticum TaxID=238834 RepID=UPI00227B6002|nr:PTS Fru family IIB subunit [Clostridium estertheticum]WAG55887.1 PTS Fru family IIB subunit [Clostridium estertheticum]
MEKSKICIVRLKEPIIKVETQGSIGIENRLTAQEILEADIVILTKDIGIKDEDRFSGNKIVRVGVSDAVKKATQIIEKIETHLNSKK